MAEFKKQSFNEYLAYMATKKMWNSIWILLLLDAILLTQFIYVNGEGFNIPVILCVCCLSIMCITTLIYAIFVKKYNRSISCHSAL